MTRTRAFGPFGLRTAALRVVEAIDAKLARVRAGLIEQRSALEDLDARGFLMQVPQEDWRATAQTMERNILELERRHEMLNQRSVRVLGILRARALM